MSEMVDPLKTMQTHQRSVFAAFLVFSVSLAYALRFINDDAFIAFRYAQNLVDGHGLVWEPGVLVQGYTSFLWTLMMAGAIRLGLDPVGASQVLGLLFYSISLCALFVLSLKLFPGRFLPLLPVLMLGTNFSFVCYATGGLETQMQVALICVSVLQTYEISQEGKGSIARLTALSLIFTLAGLTRLDSAVFILVLSAVLTVSILRTHGISAATLRFLSALLLPGAIIFALYCAWSIRTYGEILPNTFYAKTAYGSAGSFLRGTNYVYLFFTFYGFALAIIFVLLRGVIFLRNSFWVGLVAGAVLWLLYVVASGGGFMEFRFMMPVFPIVLLLITKAGSEFLRGQDAARSLLVACFVIQLLVLSVVHAVRYSGSGGVESMARLQGHLYDEDEDWMEIGKRLKTAFPGGYDRGPSIAVTAAGAIPFYSGLRTLDLYGLNDRWVARDGIVVSHRPGHQKRAPSSYIVEQKVNLVISHPRMVKREYVAETRFCPGDFGLDIGEPTEKDRTAFDRARIVRLPINATCDLAMVYLTPHSMIDQALARGTIEVIQTGLSDVRMGCRMLGPR